MSDPKAVKRKKKKKKKEKDDEKGKPLWKLAKKGDYEGVKSGLEYLQYLHSQFGQSIDVDETTSSNNMTALLWAAARGHSNIASLLIQHKANVNHANSDGLTALMCAAMTSEAECVHALIQARCDVTLRNNDGKTALLWASMVNGYEGPNGLSAEKIAERTAKNKDIIQALVGANADINAADENSMSCLLFAAAYNNVEAVDIFLNHQDKKVKLEARDADQFQSPLMWACQQTHHEIAERLIQAGADVNAKDSNGMTPLMCAAWYNIHPGLELEDVPSRTEEQEAALQAAKRRAPLMRTGALKCISLLLEAGADIDMVDDEEQTALMFAAQKLDVDMVELLLKHSANTKLRRVDGKNAIDIANMAGDDGAQIFKAISDYDKEQDKACKGCSWLC